MDEVARVLLVVIGLVLGAGIAGVVRAYWIDWKSINSPDTVFAPERVFFMGASYFIIVGTITASVTSNFHSPVGWSHIMLIFAFLVGAVSVWLTIFKARQRQQRPRPGPTTT